MTGLVARIGFRAIAGAALGKAASAGKSILGWLSSLDLVHALLLVACIALAVDHIALIVAHRHSTKVEAQLTKCTSDRAADRATYDKAQADAAAENVAHNAADKAARERITNDVSQSYEAQLASLRADLANRLRQQPSASQGAPGSTDLPGVSTAPGGSDDASRVSIPSSLYVRGAELELQLESLQRWVSEQMKVDPNKESK